MSREDVKIEELKEEKTLVDFMEEQTGIGPITAEGFVLFSELEATLDLSEVVEDGE
jgi:hypothetical protein